MGGRIVSKKRSAMGKKNTWIVAVNKARAFLKIKGFAVVKKGTPLYKRLRSSWPECTAVSPPRVSSTSGRGACSGLWEYSAAYVSDGRPAAWFVDADQCRHVYPGPQGLR